MERDRIAYLAVKTDDANPLLDFLKHWWLTHFHEEDMQFTNHLRGRLSPPWIRPI